MREFYKRHLDLIINVGILVTTLVIAFIAFKLVIPYFLPFLLGLILALAMDPLVRLFLKLKMSRAAASGLALLVTMGVSGVLLWLAISTLIWELAKFLANLPYFSSIIKEQALLLAQKLESFSAGLPPEFVTQLDKNTVKVSELLSNTLSSLASETLRLITHLPNQLLIVVIMLVATYFISKDLVKIKKRIENAIPPEFHSKL